MNDIKQITPDDLGEWPIGLHDLGSDMPTRLWVRGEGDLDDMTNRSVAVVGSRACTTYGAEVASGMAAWIGREAGWTVVSGGAFGIDQAAHRGALSVNAPTVVVLACGVDRAYPSAHATLFDAVVKAGGLLVSEYEPGEAPSRQRFLARNRLITSLTLGTVVVESAMRAGSMQAARCATEQGRPLMAVPGPVTSVCSEGTNSLIRSGKARLVSTGAEVVETVRVAETFRINR